MTSAPEVGLVKP